MPGMDLEILSGLQQMGANPSAFNFMGNGGVPPHMAALLGLNPAMSMMGPPATAFNYLAGCAPGYGQPQPWGGAQPWDQHRHHEMERLRAEHRMRGALLGIDPGGGGGAAPITADHPAHPAHPHHHAHVMSLAQQLAHSPWAQPVPLQAIQPQLPGVADRGGRVQPLGFENGAFTAAGPAVVTVRARPQRPLRGGRLVGDFTRTGLTSTGLLTLVQLVVATDGQLLSGDPISFAALSPNAFGVGINLTPAAVGNEIFATVAISALPTEEDRVDFNLTLFGLTIG